MFTASWVVSCLFFPLELFPKTRKRGNSKETSQPGKKRRNPDDKGETAEKSSKETKHRKSQQDKKVKKSVKFKATKKGVKNRGKHVKLKRKSRKWHRTSFLASKSSQILEALQIKESKKILKNKDSLRLTCKSIHYGVLKWCYCHLPTLWSSLKESGP